MLQAWEARWLRSTDKSYEVVCWLTPLLGHNSSLWLRNVATFVYQPCGWTDLSCPDKKHMQVELFTGLCRLDYSCPSKLTHMQGCRLLIVSTAAANFAYRLQLNSVDLQSHRNLVQSSSAIDFATGCVKSLWTGLPTMGCCTAVDHPHITNCCIVGCAHLASHFGHNAMPAFRNNLIAKF